MNHPRPSLTYRIMQAMMWPMLKAFGMTCETIFELSSAQMDRKLTRGETLRLRLHLIMCGLCRKLPAQFQRLRDLVRCAHEHDDHGDPSLSLPPESKSRIALRLKDGPGD